MSYKESAIVLLIRYYNVFNWLCTRLFGYSLRNGWTSEVDNFETSAHHHKILLRSVWGLEDESQIILDDHFALAYIKSTSPITSILNDPSVTLMGLTKTHAFFAVTDEDVYDLSKHPFVYMSQARHAKEIITMSLKNYIKLGSMVKTKSKILVLNNSARCGSTLMTQMLDTMPNVWAISEPEFLTQLGFLDCDFCEPVEDVIRAGFALQCKPGIRREEVELNVIKTQCMTVAYTPLIGKACPEVMHAFMFREPKGNIASIITMGRAHIDDGNYERFWQGFLRSMLKQMPVSGTPYKSTIYDMIQSALSDYNENKSGAICWALHILAYKECKTRFKLPIFPFTYQQIIKDPVGTTAKMIDHCKTSTKNVDMVTEAMKRDSQHGSFLSKEETKKKKRTANFSPEELDIMEGILKQLDLPSLEQYEMLLSM